MAGQQAPHIRAIIEADDKLSPVIDKVLASLERISGVGAASAEKLAAEFMKVEQVAKQIGVVAKEAFNPQTAAAFGEKINAEMAKTEAAFKQLGVLNKEAFSAAPAQALAKALGEVQAAATKSEAAVAKTGTSLRTASTHAGALRESLRSAAEFAKLIAGMEAGHLLKEGVTSGAKLEGAKVKLENTGAGGAEQRAAMDFARRMAREHPTQTIEQGLEDWTEMRSSSILSKEDREKYGYDDGVMKMLTENAARTRAALRSSNIGFSDYDAKNLARAAESSGRAGDKDFMARYYEGYVKAKQTYGEFITSAMYRDFVMNAKAANFSLSNEAFLTLVPAQMASMNAARLGNETAQTFNTLVGGRITKATGKWLVESGLIDEKQLEKTGPASYRILGGVKGADLLGASPMEWTAKYLTPAIERHLGHLEDPDNAKVKDRMELLRQQELKSNPNAKVDEHALRERAIHGLASDFIAQSGMRNTVVDQLVHLFANAKLLESDIARWQEAPGFKAEVNNAKNPLAAWEEFKTSLEGFAASITNPVMGNAAKTLDNWSRSIAKTAVDLNEYFEKHPDIGKGVAVGAVAAGGLTTAWLFTGVTALVRSGPRHLAAAEAHMVAARALTAAAGKTGVAGAVGGLAGKTPAGPTGTTVLPLWSRLLGGALAGYAAHEVLEMADPKGNLWGLTSPIDNWFKRHFGFNPSNMSERVEAPLSPEERDERNKRWREADQSRIHEAPSLAPNLPSGLDPSEGKSFWERMQGWFEDVKSNIHVGEFKPGNAFSSGFGPDFAPWTGQLTEATSALAAKAAEPVKVEAKAEPVEVHIAPIKVDASGMATVPGQTVRAPLNVGSQGSGVGSSLRGSERNY